MNGSTYDYWLLDLDGTLVDVEQSYIYDLFDEVGDRLGTSFTDAEAESLWYGFGPERDVVLTRANIDKELFWEVFHEVEDPEARAEATHLYDDAAAFVPRLDGPVGLVTHCQKFLTDPVLSNLGIEHWFDTVVCCTDETGWKPDPRPVELAMDELGVGHNGHTGVYVGDDPKDVQAARNANIDSIHVARRIPDRVSHTVSGDQQVDSLAEISD